MTEDFELHKAELNDKSKAFMRVVIIFAIAWLVLNGGSLIADVSCWLKTRGDCGHVEISFCEKMAQSMTYIVKAGNESLKWLLICACVFYGNLTGGVKAIVDKFSQKSEVFNCDGEK